MSFFQSELGGADRRRYRTRKLVRAILDRSSTRNRRKCRSSLAICRKARLTRFKISAQIYGERHPLRLRCIARVELEPYQF
jgi:hypothetical protein